MGISQLTKAVAIFAVLMASSGQLPKLVVAVRMAQAKLIQETKASKWGQLPLLPISR